MKSPHENPKFSELGISQKAIAQYHAIFFEVLKREENQIDLDDLLQKFSISHTTIKKHLRVFISIYPQLLLKLSGFYPEARTIIDMAEEQIGKANSGNLFEINKTCKGIVDKITKPKHLRFLSHLLTEFSDEKDFVSISKNQLIDLLYDNYVDFIHETDNGLVSIAGRLNEEIFIRAFRNYNLTLDDDFKRTGQESEGDLIVFQKTGNRDKLYIEIKSYHARERLLRGLQDIDQPKKIGVGFFINPSEFNPQRTQTLLASNALAIYLPETTYNKLEQESRSMTTAQQNNFYRPLGMLLDDMVFFKQHGKIKDFR